jgi:hypothetical protein
MQLVHRYASGNILHLHLASFGMRCELPVTTLAPVLRTVVGPLYKLNAVDPRFKP